MGTAGPLKGLRVLDTASMYAAPLIATLLADHGADVIKVEPPSGDAYRQFPGRIWSLVARRKRSVVLDLKDDGDCDRLRHLVKNMDVMVVNLPTAKLAERGLDFETLSAINPALIMAQFTGFGLSGPNADRTGNGTVAEAYAGLTHMTGEPDGAPVLPSLPLGDTVSAYVGAFGVLAACYDRLANGARGRLIDVNAVDTVLHLSGTAIAAYGGTGEPPSRLGNRLPGPPLRNVFGTRDGKYIAFGVSTPRQIADVAELVGHPGRPESSSPELEDSVRAWTAERTRDQALDELLARRLMVSPVNDARDIFEDTHLRARGSLVTVETQEYGPVTNPAPAPRFVGEGVPPGGQTPVLGADTDAVLGDLAD